MKQNSCQSPKYLHGEMFQQCKYRIKFLEYIMKGPKLFLPIIEETVHFPLRLDDIEGCLFTFLM